MPPSIEPSSQAKRRNGRDAAQASLSPGLQALRDLVASFSFDQIERRAAEGLKAVWGGSTWEAPLIYACDTVPIAMAELWREKSREAESVGERELQIPSEFCSMIKVVAGRLHLRTSKNIRRIIHFGGGCEPMGLAIEMMKREGYDVHCIEGVHAFHASDKRPETIQILVHEFERIAKWLTGKGVDQDRLGEELRKKNVLLSKLRRVLALRRSNPLYLTSVPTVQLLNGSSHCYGNPEEYLRVIDLLIGELEVAATLPTPERYIPLVLAGGAVSPSILNVIEESNGAILGWILVGTVDYREDIPPLESLAHYLLDAQARGELGEGAGASATFRRYRVEALVRETGAKGVISTAVTGCPYASIVQQMERTHFKNLGVSFIGLETNVHKERPSEEQIMRVRTFMEMLN
jgi:benzoyl-CoA reductase/2-hydroxyglutaryl-CoA dehydratase subunit BcrC/BadD/HgdB